MVHTCHMFASPFLFYGFAPQRPLPHPSLPPLSHTHAHARAHSHTTHTHGRMDAWTHDTPPHYPACVSSATHPLTLAWLQAFCHSGTGGTARGTTPSYKRWWFRRRASSQLLRTHARVALLRAFDQKINPKCGVCGTVYAGAGRQRCGARRPRSAQIRDWSTPVVAMYLSCEKITIAKAQTNNGDASRASPLAC